jgi:hypothetical protein
MQTHRKIGSRCFVTDDDIEQDLLLAAFSDSSFVPRLRAIRRENYARKIAYRFADNARRRHCRKYLSKWVRLAQPRSFDT